MKWLLAISLASCACGASVGTASRGTARVEEPSARSAAVPAVRNDPFSLLTPLETRECPPGLPKMDSFMAGGGKWWARGVGVPALFGFEQPEPEQRIDSLLVQVAQLVTDDFALHAFERDVVVHGLRDGRELFRVALTPPPGRLKPAISPSVRGAATTDTDLALVVTGFRQSELVVVDRESGRERWRRPWSSDYGHVPAFAGGRALVRTDAGYAAWELGSGRELWSLPAPVPAERSFGPRVLGDAVALSELAAGGVTLVEARDGKPRCLLTASDPIQEVLTVGQTLVALTGSSEQHRARLVGFDLLTCRQRWSSEPFATDHGAVARVLGDHVLLTSHQQARIYDQEGKLVWHYGLDVETPLAFEAAQGAPRLAFLTSRVDERACRIVIFKPARQAPPLERLSLRGRVRWNGAPIAGTTVLAYGASATTDAEGRYELSLEARGSVLVTALTESPATSHVELTGAGQYEVDLHGEEVDECENCD